MIKLGGEVLKRFELLVIVEIVIRKTREPNETWNEIALNIDEKRASCYL